MKIENKNYVPFTMEHVKNKCLVINMLKYEEKLIKSKYGQERYKIVFYNPYSSLDINYSFNRETLTHFNFINDKDSLINYRRIFKTYFNSPDDYDKDVINSSFYMRNNRCIFYKSKILNKGDIIPNVILLNINGKTNTDLYTALEFNSGKYNKYMLCAFSNSWPPFLQRKYKLFSLAKKLKEEKIKLILIQIHEAHSNLWPVALPEQLESHKSITDRIKKAQEFVKLDNPPYDVFIDTWDDIYEQTFRAWPDKYYFIDNNGIILNKSEYNDAKIKVDCIDLLIDYIN